MNKAKEEYFELLRQLNKSNKTKNEVTQLNFIVVKSVKSRAMLYATVSKSQKILLCMQFDKVWKPAGFSGYDDLENFICNNMRSVVDQNMTKYILGNLFKLGE